jgi:uncharacterized integral membrane protein
MRLLLVSPFVLVLILFALSNTEPVRLVLWPTDYTLNSPVSLVVLVAMAIAFLLGGIVVWLGELGQRARARRAERAARSLQAQLRELKARLPQQAALPARAALPPPR